jgi:hypothetical protein
VIRIGFVSAFVEWAMHGRSELIADGPKRQPPRAETKPLHRQSVAEMKATTSPQSVSQLGSVVMPFQTGL